MNSLYFRLFSNCIPVKGATSGIICDLENNLFFEIPNSLIEVIVHTQDNFISIEKIKKTYDYETYCNILSFFENLSNQNFGFFTKDPHIYNKLNLIWDSPQKITNAILEINKQTQFDVNNVINQLEEFGCSALEFRFLDICNLDFIDKILMNYNNSTINCFIIMLNHSSVIDEKELYTFYRKHSRIGVLVLYIGNQKTNLLSINKDFNIKIKQNKLTSFMNEEISSEKFIVNIRSFSEAINYNLGLNRKISITYNGEVKNHINHKKSFGYIQKNKIQEIIESKDFQQQWYISHDKVEICKDCQYRYICPDTSEIIKINNKLLKINRCKFNPYENIWQNNQDNNYNTNN